MMGGDSNGVLFKDYCWQEWKDKYGTKPPWKTKEFTQLADARSRFDDEDLARSTWNTFLKSEDPFHEGHSPGQFLYSLSKMTARAAKVKPQKQVEGEGVSRLLRRMAEIAAEVDKDHTIPESERQNEYKKRWAAERELRTV